MPTKRPVSPATATGPSAGPDVPLGLSDDARATWSNVFASTPWLIPADAFVVQMLAESEEERGHLRERVMSGTGSPRDRAALRALDAQLVAILSLLGLTPLARHKLGARIPTPARDGSMFDPPRALSVIDSIKMKRLER